MRPILTCALLLSALPSHAQDTAPAGAHIDRPTPNLIPKARLTGHILCNDTRQPARGATLMLQPIPNSRQPADQSQRPTQPHFGRVALDGAYLIDHVPAGDYALLAFFPGYLSPIDDFILADQSDLNDAMAKQLSSAEIIHIPADGTQTADLLLERGATVSGRVLFSDGVPASQVAIALEDVNAKPAGAPGPSTDAESFNMGAMYRNLFTHQTLFTDDEGHFRIAGIHPGTYRVSVVQPFSFADLESGGDGVGEAFGLGIMGGGDPRAAHFYAGDTFHKKSAKTYEFRAGDTIGDLDIRIPIDAFQDVRIHLAAPDGRPINSAALTLTDSADESIHFALKLMPVRPVVDTDSVIGNSDGIFAFRSVPPGTYTLAVTSAAILISATPGPAKVPGPISGAIPVTPGLAVIVPDTSFSDSVTTIIVKDSSTTDIQLTLIPKPVSTSPNPDPLTNQLPRDRPLDRLDPLSKPGV